MMKFKCGRVLSITYIIILTTLLVIPLGDTHIEEVTVSGFRGDYVVHMLVYTPWTFLGKLLFAEKFSTFSWTLVGVIFVATMEVIQYFIPYRGYNTNDLIAGEIGILVSLLVYRVLRRLFPI